MTYKLIVDYICYNNNAFLSYIVISRLAKRNNLVLLLLLQSAVTHGRADSRGRCMRY